MLDALPWILFTGFVLAMLALDLGVFHRHAHAVSRREALAWSVFWIGLALLFNAGVYWQMGTQSGLEWTTGYLIEKSLSVDNIFVFLIIFAAFRVPPAYQHRVLFWGILGALIMRGALIAVGAALLENFHWIIYIFGGFLIFTGLRFLRSEGPDPDVGHNPVVRFAQRHFRTTADYEGQRFFVKRGGVTYITPLLLVLLVIESTDLVFAVDSIPAVFAITRDPFIVYTSNVFAILGLRALFFLLAGYLNDLRFLKHALAAVLVFVGAKMVLTDIYHIDPLPSLAVVALILTTAVVASLKFPEDAPSVEPEPVAAGPGPAGSEEPGPSEDDRDRAGRGDHA